MALENFVLLLYKEGRNGENAGFSFFHHFLCSDLILDEASVKFNNIVANYSNFILIERNLDVAELLGRFDLFSVNCFLHFYRLAYFFTTDFIKDTFSSLLTNQR